MKILLSAYACEPDRGSEPEVGLRAMLAAARDHDVWVLTRTNNLPKLRRVVADEALLDRIHLEGIDLGPPARRAKRLGLLGLHWYYEAWQREAARTAIELDRMVDFDVVHHVTFASHWTRAGVSAVRKPFLWGPVGGGVDPIISLFPELGIRGALEDIGRLALRRISETRPSVRSLPRVATLTLVQNVETRERLRGAPMVRTLPNATVVHVGPVLLSSSRERSVAFVGRLTPWKGARLAVRAFRYVKDPQVTLRIFGDGPDRRSVERTASRLGLMDRVIFEGQVPRAELIDAVARSAVLLHPAMHDESPLSLAEALCLGTPVVALDHGGPAELVRWWPRSPCSLVAPSTPSSTAKRLALEVDRFLLRPLEGGPDPLKPDQGFEAGILDAYETVAGSSSRARRRI